MPITVIDKGSQNEVSIPEIVMAENDATIIFEGSRNKVTMAENTMLSGAVLRLFNESSFQSGVNVRLAAIQVFCFINGHVQIGAHTGFTWQSDFKLHEQGQIRIGEKCLLASGTVLSISDMHSIIDIESGLRINPAKNISIGDNVWLAEAVRVMKGSVIGSGSIIGYGSIVVGSIPDNCIAVGVPAKTVRSGVTWRHELI